MCHVRRILCKKLLSRTWSELMEKSPRFGDLDFNPILTANLLWNKQKLLNPILSQVLHWQSDSKINTLRDIPKLYAYILDRYNISTNS